MVGPSLAPNVGAFEMVGIPVAVVGSLEMVGSNVDTNMLGALLGALEAGRASLIVGS